VGKAPGDGSSAVLASMAHDGGPDTRGGGNSLCDRLALHLYATTASPLGDEGSEMELGDPDGTTWTSGGDHGGTAQPRSAWRHLHGGVGDQGRGAANRLPLAHVVAQTLGVWAPK
jgi:hypothetical protein